MSLLQELFAGSKYKFVNENDVYKLIISNPKVEDTGKYTIEIAGIACTAYLDVEGKPFAILFASYLMLTEDKIYLCLPPLLSAHN
jgi:hypothetical protein